MISDFISKHDLKARFVLVGIWNTVFGYLVFYLLDSLFMLIFAPRYIAYMSAMILGYVISIINAYIFHKYITFKSSVKGRGIVAEFLRFFMTYSFALVLSLLLLPFLVEVFHIEPKISGAVVILVCTLTSYIGHSRFSFRQAAD